MVRIGRSVVGMVRWLVRVIQSIRLGASNGRGAGDGTARAELDPRPASDRSGGMGGH
ncbi:MAG: hypothetical protein ACO394_11285 [Blastocatellia bacterium]